MHHEPVTGLHIMGSSISLVMTHQVATAHVQVCANRQSLISNDSYHTAQRQVKFHEYIIGLCANHTLHPPHPTFWHGKSLHGLNSTASLFVVTCLLQMAVSICNYSNTCSSSCIATPVLKSCTVVPKCLPYPSQSQQGWLTGSAICTSSHCLTDFGA